MLFEFNESDFLQSTIVEPAWYRVRIEEVEDRLSKDGQSTNTWLKGKILFNADNGDKKFANVPTPFPWLFNSKGAWAVIPFARALGMEVKPGKRFDPVAAKGREIDMFIENGLNPDGVVVNVCKNKYRTPKTAPEAATT